MNNQREMLQSQKHCPFLALRRALCAWCSIPDKKTAAPKEEWQFRTDFSDLHEEFPELVEKTGKGWFYRHVHKVEKFISKSSEKVSKTTLSNAVTILTALFF